VQQDAGFRHEGSLDVKRADESYVDYFRRGSDARSRVERVTPSSLTPEQRMDELLIFALLSGLPVDDPLRRARFPFEIIFSLSAREHPFVI
jgi:hypothetical protein